MIFRLLNFLTIICCVTAAPAQTIIVDNATPQFTVELGSWQTGTATGEKYGPGYRFASQAHPASLPAPVLPQTSLSTATTM